ncbi:hypothetical protein RND71_041131 [Anisodus tanguticus]|uniref:Uncharacterized protein n=1 Tax=Anisodus tanguticus TaxID=243964 RepID=A0AAE1UWE3_9SOLA|nr:hypothetical protein RND71_041131 [Anisodus tanguticus]
MSPPTCLATFPLSKMPSYTQTFLVSRKTFSVISSCSSLNFLMNVSSSTASMDEEA